MCTKLMPVYCNFSKFKISSQKMDRTIYQRRWQREFQKWPILESNVEFRVVREPKSEHSSIL